MFDNPNKSLKELQEQLMEAEEPEEDIFAPANPTEQDELDEQESPAKKQTRTALLVALLLLEVAALLAVVAWWLLWK